MNEYKKIISDIKSKLTNDKEQNIKILKEAGEKYKDHEYAIEITKEIGRLIADNISEDQMKEFQELIVKDVRSHFEKGIEFLKKDEPKKAKKEFLEFVEFAENMFNKGEDKVSKLYSPSNPIEFIYIMDDESKDARDIGSNFDDGYCYLGSISIDLKDYKESEEYFDKAIRWNPYNAMARFEKAELFKIQGKLDDFYEETLNAYSYLYKPEDLSRYYRNIGYYNIEKSKFELARASFLYSIQFDSSRQEMVINELTYIDSVAKIKKDLPEISEIIELLEKEKIPIFFEQRNVGIVYSLYNDMKKDNALDSPLGEFVSYLKDFYSRFIGE